MILYSFSFILALTTSTVLIILLIYKFNKFLNSNRESSLRDNHTKAISRFGGIGIALSFFITVATIIYLPDSILNLSDSRLIVFLFCSICCFILGLADDLWTLRARLKLVIQIIIAGIFSFYGFRIEELYLPLFGTIETGWLAYPITLFWIIGVINAVNLIDGLDGLASGISMIALAVLGFLVWKTQSNIALILSLILIGSIAGFWLFNRHPASIFMGDSGSYFLGFNLAVLTLYHGFSPSISSTSLIPLFLLAVPLVDTSFAFFRRYLKGIPFYSADRDHIHHRLIAKGISKQNTVRILYSMEICFGTLAILTMMFPDFEGVIAVGFIGIIYFFLFSLEYEEIRKPINTIQQRSFLKKRRSLCITFSENLKLFLNQNQTREEVFRTFCFWAEQMRIEAVVISHGKKDIFKHGEFPKDENSYYRYINHRIEDWNIVFLLAEEELVLDSDVKGDLILRATQSIVDRLEELEDVYTPRFPQKTTGKQETISGKETKHLRLITSQKSLERNKDLTLKNKLKEAIVLRQIPEARKLLRQSGNEIHQALRWYCLGSIEGDSGNSRNALRYYLKALTHVKELNDSDDREFITYRATRALAITKCKLGQDYDGAVELLEGLLKHPFLKNKKKWQKQIQTTLAAIHYFNDHFTEVIQKLEVFQKESEKNTSPIWNSQVFLFLALSYQRLRNNEKGESCFRQALEEFLKIPKSQVTNQHFLYGWVGWIPLAQELYQLAPSMVDRSIMDEVFHPFQNGFSLYQLISTKGMLPLSEEAKQEIFNEVPDIVEKSVVNE